MQPTTFFAFAHAIVDERYQVTNQQLQMLAVEHGQQGLIGAAQLHQIQQQLQQWHIAPQRSAGGSIANSLAAAALLGQSSTLHVTVGHDSNAQAFIQQTASANLQLHAKKQHGDTGTCMVLIDESGERSMLTCLGNCANIEADDLDWQALKASQWLLIEGYLLTVPANLQLAMECIQLAKQHGVSVAFTLSDPAMANYFNAQAWQILALQPEVIFCNEAEFALLADAPFSVMEAQQWLAKVNQNGLLVVTQGEMGASAITCQQSVQQPLLQAVQVVDTNGAGDAFMGGFMAAFSQNDDLGLALQAGQAFAADIVAQMNARLIAKQ